MQSKPYLKNYKILFCDLDGTLLDDKNVISKENIEYIQKFKENNYTIVICTGRPLFNVIEKCKTVIFQENEKNVYIIASNGAEIFDFFENKVLVDDALPLNLVTKVWKYCEINHLFIFTFFNHKKHYFLINTYENVYKNNIHPIIYHCEEFLCIPKVVDATDFKLNHYLSNKLHIINFSLPVRKIINDLNLLSQNNVDISYSSKTILEITNKGINKGFGVRFICNKLNISLNEVITVGDNGNDISMFEVSGLSFALKNALDSAKKAAKVVLDKSNNQSIIKEIYLTLN